jgi:signal transduction histidine kinase
VAGEDESEAVSAFRVSTTSICWSDATCDADADGSRTWRAVQNGWSATLRRRRSCGLSEERRRIARELHDISARGVSVIVAQARAGRHLTDDPRASGIFRVIESTGREALVELRRLLGISRSEDQQLAIGPQPGVSSLKALVEQVRGSVCRLRCGSRASGFARDHRIIAWALYNEPQASEASRLPRGKRIPLARGLAPTQP